MGEHQSILDRIISHLRSTSKYYTGYPKDLGPSMVINFISERQFVQLLHEGRPVVVAFTIRCSYTKHLDKVLEEAAAEFYPHIKFLRVECPKYPGFCITRQRKEYPFIEVFHSPEQVGMCGQFTLEYNVQYWQADTKTEVFKTLLKALHTTTQAANQGKVVDPNITKYSVKVLPFNYDQSTYGFREYFKRHGMYVPSTN